MLGKLLRPQDIVSYQSVGELTHFELIRSRRYQRPLSFFALIAVDALEDVVAEKTSAETDELVSRLKEKTRRIDIFELSAWESGLIYLVCPETNAPSALGLADRLRNMPELTHYKLGASTFPDDGSSIEMLLKVAHDRATMHFSQASTS